MAVLAFIIFLVTSLFLLVQGAIALKTAKIELRTGPVVGPYARMFGGFYVVMGVFIFLAGVALLQME